MFSQGSADTVAGPSGLLHALPMQRGTPVPPELTNLGLKGVFIEADEKVNSSFLWPVLCGSSGFTIIRQLAICVLATVCISETNRVV
jgi:hypothetical protein